MTSLPTARPKSSRLTRTFTALAAVAALALLSGCANDALADQYSSGTQQNYISGEGVFKEWAPAERGDSVSFEGVSETDEPISSEDYAGEVYVVNFWYAGCPPCRLEAPILKELSEEYAAKGVNFLGVNTYDQQGTSAAFTRKYEVPYPSILDANDVAVQFAFSKSIAPNAVPTTLVLDREGRVAARWSGGLPNTSNLAAMIDTVVDEEG